MKLKLICLRGSATLTCNPSGEPLILTGKRRRPDILFWSLWGKTDSAKEMAVGIQGLYRGKYADAVIEARELYKALISLGENDRAAILAKACAANDVNLKT